MSNIVYPLTLTGREAIVQEIATHYPTLNTAFENMKLGRPYLKPTYNKPGRTLLEAWMTDQQQYITFEYEKLNLQQLIGVDITESADLRIRISNEVITPLKIAEEFNSLFGFSFTPEDIPFWNYAIAEQNTALYYLIRGMPESYIIHGWVVVEIVPDVIEHDIRFNSDGVTPRVMTGLEANRIIIITDIQSRFTVEGNTRYTEDEIIRRQI